MSTENAKKVCSHFFLNNDLRNKLKQRGPLTFEDITTELGMDCNVGEFKDALFDYYLRKHDELKQKNVSNDFITI